MQAFILTGGLGTRLRPLTLEFPKPLLPIANVPFLCYPFSLLKTYGINEATLCTASSPKPYLAHLKKEMKSGFKISVSTETKPLGTAGAFKNAEKFLHRDADLFFAMNGDILTDVPLDAMIRFHRKMNLAASVALISVPDPSAFGLAQMDQSGSIKKFIEKPKLASLPKAKNYPVNAGIYLLRKDVLDLIPKDKECSIEREIFPLLLAKKMGIAGFITPAKTCWIDIGTPEKYLRANQAVVRGETFFSKIVPFERIAKSARIHPQAHISKDTVIAPHCKIGAGSSIESSVLLERSTVGLDVQIQNAIMGRNVRIGDHARVVATQILGENSCISPYSKL